MECEHDYEIIEEDIETEVTKFLDGEAVIEVTGYAVFFCKKCLDVQKKVF